MEIKATLNVTMSVSKELLKRDPARAIHVALELGNVALDGRVVAPPSYATTVREQSFEGFDCDVSWTPITLLYKKG